MEETFRKTMLNTAGFVEATMEDIKIIPVNDGWFRCIKKSYWSEKFKCMLTESWYEKPVGDGDRVLYDYSQQLESKT